MKCIFLTVVVQLIAQAFAHENCLSSAIIGDSRRLFRRDGIEFGYTDNQQERWYTLPNSGLCSTGKQQSPIDFIGDSYFAPSPNIIWGTAENLEFEHRGTTVEVSFKNVISKATLALPGVSDVYELVQFHFHAPSEHRVNGFRYKLEAHFVFKSPKTSALSVLGIFFKIGDSSSPLIRQIVPFLPSKKGEKTEIPSLDLSFMKCATSQTETVFKYEGSLTTPPCTEGIKWNVLKKPLQITSKDLFKFWHVMPYNARNTQPTFGRGPSE